MGIPMEIYIYIYIYMYKSEQAFTTAGQRFHDAAAGRDPAPLIGRDLPPPL